MIRVVQFALLWIMSTADDYYYHQYNVSRTTLSGIAAYGSDLTLDWLAAEDARQRELAVAFEAEPSSPSNMPNIDCVSYLTPSGEKVGRLMMELFKNLEGDDGILIAELIQTLVRKKMLVETSPLDSELDLEALLKTPGVMMGEPHSTFPRILAMIWLIITDPVSVRKYGWCPINKVNKYLTMTSPSQIAKHMQALDPIMARVRIIMEEFIHNMTPLNMYQKKTTKREDMQKISTQNPKPVMKTTTPIFMEPNRLVDIFEHTVTTARKATTRSFFPSFLVAISWLIVMFY